MDMGHESKDLQIIREIEKITNSNWKIIMNKEKKIIDHHDLAIILLSWL